MVSFHYEFSLIITLKTLDDQILKTTGDICKKILLLVSTNLYVQNTYIGYARKLSDIFFPGTKTLIALKNVHCTKIWCTHGAYTVHANFDQSVFLRYILKE